MPTIEDKMIEILFEKIADLENEIEALKEERGDLMMLSQAMNTNQPCGHIARYIVTKGTTHFCALCAMEAKG